MKSLTESVLYTFVDSAYLHGRDPIELTKQLCQGGSDLIQLRAKDWDRERISRTGQEMRVITAAFGVGLVINDHLEIARQIKADFCHLGQEDFFDGGHVKVGQLPGAGKDPEVGLSTHAPEQAERALAAGPSYVAIGPVFATGTKPTARPVTLEYVRWADRNVSIPWFAIGGINLANVDQVMAAGAKRICVVSAILNQADIVTACRLFREKLSSG